MLKTPQVSAETVKVVLQQYINPDVNNPADPFVELKNLYGIDGQCCSFIYRPVRITCACCFFKSLNLVQKYVILSCKAPLKYKIC